MEFWISMTDIPTGVKRIRLFNLPCTDLPSFHSRENKDGASTIWAVEILFIGFQYSRTRTRKHAT